MRCHTPEATNCLGGSGSVALVGHPNVGKSAIFHHLTGRRVAVSNYPGTTVELARGSFRDLPEVQLLDTPGVLTFPPQSDDEQVTARVLLDEPLKAIVQVGDAKNLRRTLLLTVQLAEMGLPLVLALNMMDEAETRGVAVNHQSLEQVLGIKVVPTTAVHKRGLKELVAALEAQPVKGRSIVPLRYPEIIEEAVDAFCERVEKKLELHISGRSLALLWLCQDPVSETWLSERLTAGEMQELARQRVELQSAMQFSPTTAIQQARLDHVEHLSRHAFTGRQEPGVQWQSFSTWLGRLTTHPVWGLFILAGVLYALYWFVGIFGASTLVGWLEEGLFGRWLNPAVVGLVESLSLPAFLRDLLVGDYGLWTMGMTYALALILPIVTTFFLAFGVLEDSGYLPRLAALSNRVFVFLGLNGKAVLPMVLGLGCVTMATLTTRVLETRRERLLVTLLLALAVPCSAQLGVVMGMLAGISIEATLLWGGGVLTVLLAVGWLAARLFPGERSHLLVELPPLRWPLFTNVMLKTLARLEWYLKEVLPLFLAGSLLMFLLDKSSLLAWLIRLGEPVVVGWLGLPSQASAAFLMGFLRRDFGATGLFVMQSQGLLNPAQVVVAMTTITLFIPCIASVLMIGKERGFRTALGMFAVIMPLAILVGGSLNKALLALGWGT